MYQELINVVNERKVLEAQTKLKKTEFEQVVAIEVAKLSDLKDKESDLRLEVLAKMKEEDKTNMPVGDNSIILNTKITRKVVDTKALMASITGEQDLINELLDGDVADDICLEAFEPKFTIKDKAKVDEVIDKVFKVEGRLLEGVEDNITEFLTIR